MLHVELLPFLWPGGTSQLSKEYWTWARQQDKEGAMWKADVAASDEGYQKVVALLEGCDIMRKVSGQVCCPRPPCAAGLTRRQGLFGTRRYGVVACPLS